MPVTYLYPEVRELREIAPELIDDLTTDDLSFKLMPIREVNAPLIQWSIDDDARGLQQLRGVDGSPLSITPLGKNSYVSKPGYFGEFSTVTEEELDLRAGSVVGDVQIDVSDLVVSRFKQLLGREIRQIRRIIWTLLTTGTFSVSSKNGSLVYTDTFAIQTYTGSSWATPATATPLADFRGVQQLGTGLSVNFGSNAIAAMNRVTANRMFNNTNANDLAGRKTTGGGTITSAAAVNTITLNEDLPTVVIHDKGVKDDSGTFVKDIPDGKVVVVGTREDGGPIGEYRQTINSNNPGRAPGPYEKIIDRTGDGPDGQQRVPPNIELHRGHNGGPVLYRPSAVVVMSV